MYIYIILYINVICFDQIHFLILFPPNIMGSFLNTLNEFNDFQYVHEWGTSTRAWATSQVYITEENRLSSCQLPTAPQQGDDKPLPPSMLGFSYPHIFK